MLCNQCDLKILKAALKNLTEEEQELINFVFLDIKNTPFIKTVLLF
ncbi:RNA polymerase, sigma-24 subunit, ECF subfamily [Clostridium botulinum E1 str. 'BoNT E Beluga']|nr:RNA polymerase, sigma-24 subunit, ECF subfamily [Clostridium botulinum E1 str. 'BoNT E Beluga']